MDHRSMGQFLNSILNNEVAKWTHPDAFIQTNS